MTSLSTEQIYVADLKVPSCLLPKKEVRREIPKPDRFNIHSGYWTLRPPDEKSAVTGYADLSLTLEFVGANLRAAEERALKIARTFSSIASSYGGYPVETPYLYRIASVGITGGSTSQHHYHYRPRPHMLSTFDLEGASDFQQYLTSASSIGDAVRRQLESAFHWYGIAIGADDPAVSYVAAWTALESIGASVDSIAHPNGAKVHCKTCKNEAGKNRNRTLAGITHMFERLADGHLSVMMPDDARDLLARELRSGFSTEEAKTLRDAIVHGLEEIEPLIQRSVDARRHLIHVLNASIQIVMGPNVKSWMTGDYDFHPDARFSLKFRKGLKNQPYHGEWVEGPRWEVRPGTQGTAPPRSTVEWEIAPDLVESMSKQWFKRNVDIYSFSDESVLTDPTTWDDRLEEPVWEAMPASGGEPA